MIVNPKEVLDNLRKLQSIMGQWEVHYSKIEDENRTSVHEGLENAYSHCSLMVDRFIIAVDSGPAAIEELIKQQEEDLPEEDQVEEEVDDEADEDEQPESVNGPATQYCPHCGEKTSCGSRCDKCLGNL